MKSDSAWGYSLAALPCRLEQTGRSAVPARKLRIKEAHAMNFIVINASPKIKNSITLQHIRLFEKNHPEHQFEFVHIAGKISLYEKKEQSMDALMEKMRMAHAVIWCFPVYYLLVPSQLKRFVELVFDRYPASYFKGCYATCFTTSIHFFDHTAHNYMQAVCEDLGFSFIDSYSAHMDDFFEPENLEKMDRFFTWFTQMVSQQGPVHRKFPCINPLTPRYAPKAPPPEPAALNAPASEKILLLTDEQEPDTNLKNMTDMFIRLSGRAVQKVNIHGIGLKNGCLGCCTCGYDNTCVQKDGFVRFYNTCVRTAGTIMIAGTIKDHYLSAQWKKFFDRSFFNGHAPILQGKRIGFIISGPLSQVQNLQEILDAMVANWHMKPVGTVTDEHETPDLLTGQIRGLANRLALCEKHDPGFGRGFYEVAGGKIFRDFVFATSAVFRADHIFYKKMGIYRSFPQRRLSKRLKNGIFAFFMSLKPARKKIHKQFIPAMVAPYKKVLEKRYPDELKM